MPDPLNMQVKLANKRFLSSVVHEYATSTRNLDYTTVDSKRCPTMPSQGSLFNNFEDVQVSLNLLSSYLFTIICFKSLHMSLLFAINFKFIHAFLGKK